MNEMKIMELAALIYNMGDGDVIDFASGTEGEVGQCGGWFGVRPCNPFDNDNLIYIVGHYGGEADTWLYTLSEYDDHIGDFCEKELSQWWDRTDQHYINCIGRMLADVFLRCEGVVPEVVTVDMNEEG